MDATKAKIILYVEDDPVVLMAYRYRLERVGYAVESARDGLEAMKVLARLVPDLMVLDLMMPRFDGAEVLKYMQADPRLKTVPVIILSTNSITDAADEYILEGASRRFVKDKCTFPILLHAITELLGKAPVKADAAPVKPVAPGRPGKLVKTAV
jgi:CheY-like chemotaxis protein